MKKRFIPPLLILINDVIISVLRGCVKENLNSKSRDVLMNVKAFQLLYARVSFEQFSQICSDNLHTLGYQIYL